MRRFVVASLAPVLVVVAAGCGSSSNSSSTKSSSTPAAAPTTTAAATPPAGATAIGVSETEFKLSPADPNLKKGGKVAILATNRGKVTHAIEVEGGGAGGKDVRSADIAAGKSATIAVDLKPGKTYEWYCPIDGHKGLGMKGEIKVAGASASTSSSSAKTSTGSSSSGSSGGSSSGSSSGSSGGGGYGY